MPGEQIVFGREGIKKLIAHREPMLFLDRVVLNSIGVRLVAKSDSYPPDRLRVLEAMGQASALLIRQTPAYIRYSYPAFVAMQNVEWKAIPDAANCVEYRVRYSEAKRSRARFGYVDASALAADTEVCSAELCFSFLDG